MASNLPDTIVEVELEHGDHELHHLLCALVLNGVNFRVLGFETASVLGVRHLDDQAAIKAKELQFTRKTFKQQLVQNANRICANPHM